MDKLSEVIDSLNSIKTEYQNNNRLLAQVDSVIRQFHVDINLIPGPEFIKIVEQLHMKREHLPAPLADSARLSNYPG